MRIAGISSAAILAAFVFATATAGSAGYAVAQPLSLKRAQPEVQRPTTPVGDKAVQGVQPSKTVPLRPFDTRGITVNSLDAVNAEAVGLIGYAEGGFAASLWQGTGWSLVESLMPRLPEISRSPVMRSLSSRLLLSRGVVPEDKPEEANFIQMRVDRLVAMGDVENALALIKVVPEARRDELYARTEADTLFLADRRTEACTKANGAVARFQDVYWRQAQAFCLALKGQHARAALMSDLLRERDTDTPPVFYAAIERLGGLETATADVPAAPNGLILAMVMAAKLDLSEQMIKNAQPAAQRAIAQSTDVDPDIRLVAAEAALAVGALTDDEAMKLYLGFPFGEDEIRSPLTTAEENWGPRARALLVKAASSQPVSLGKAEVLRRSWELGRARGGYSATVRASIPVVAGMSAEISLSAFAETAARTLFAGGRLDEAMAWYRLVAADSDRSPELKAAADALWPLAVLADTSETIAWDPDRLARWYAGARDADPESAQRRALTLFTLLDATGREIPDPLWRNLLDAPMVSLEPGLNRAWEYGLDKAAADNRLGETILLIVTGAAATGDGTYPSNGPGYRAIAALRRVGLDADARRLAIETAIAAGF